MSTVIVRQKDPGCLIQLLWFALIGWWLGQLWIAIAWALMVSIIGIPIAVIMLNKIPAVMALRNPDSLMVTRKGDVVVVSESPQHNLLIRAIYFLLIGWWFSGIWLEVAYALCLTIIGLPLGFWMFDRVPGIVSLRR